jgi:hypothetical protein
MRSAAGERATGFVGGAVAATVMSCAIGASVQTECNSSIALPTQRAKIPQRL